MNLLVVQQQHHQVVVVYMVTHMEVEQRELMVEALQEEKRYTQTHMPQVKQQLPLVTVVHQAMEVLHQPIQLKQHMEHQQGIQMPQGFIFRLQH